MSFGRLARFIGMAALAVGCSGTPAADGGNGSKPQGQPAAGHETLVAKIDSLVSVPIKAGKVAGASVAVVKGRDTILVRAYGSADLELAVPTPPHATYEIGSVTKQFTAAAVMQLVEQGKINLDDDITKYLPGYSEQGNKISVRNLLNHTSGIKGYTEMPEFRLLGFQKLSRDTLVKLFSKRPFDFKTGEEQIYNNSAFFLAGLIIEKASGKSYADYVKENLFAKAGMSDSYYCSERTIHKGHAHGYDTDSAGLVLKGYLDHTWPYAAGSLCSSAIDLVGWNQALHGGKILGAPAYQELIAPATLNDGTKLRYSKGLALHNIAGHRAISHGGGINGFLSMNDYFPEDTLSVVVLFNTAGPVGPGDVAEEIAEAVLGKGPDQSKPFEGDLSQFSGTYKGHGRGQDSEVTFALADGKLTVKMAGRGPQADSAKVVKYLGDDTFALKETHFKFERTGGKVARLRVDVSYGYNFLKRQ